MPPTNSGHTDLTKGIYRRMYAGFLTGKRINSVSLGAEALFWRLQALADDFGNLSAELLAAAAFPRRTVSESRAAGWVDELVKAGLLLRYQDRGDDYLSLVDFQHLQPAGKNGRRVQRYPLNPDVAIVARRSEDRASVDPGESKDIHGDPGELLQPSPAQQQAHKHSHSQKHSEEQRQAQTDSPPSPPPPPDDCEPAPAPASAAQMRARAEMLRCLRACLIKPKAAEDLLLNPNCTPERVTFLWHRIRTEKPDNAGGFMRRGIEEGWEVKPLILRKARTLADLQTAAGVTA